MAGWSVPRAAQAAVWILPEGDHQRQVVTPSPSVHSQSNHLLS